MGFCERKRSLVAWGRERSVAADSAAELRGLACGDADLLACGDAGLDWVWHALVRLPTVKAGERWGFWHALVRLPTGKAGEGVVLDTLT